MLAVARQASKKVLEQAARGFRSSAIAKGGHGVSSSLYRGLIDHLMD
jgi:hypothetical protein